MDKPVGLSRRSLFFTAAASSLLTACGGGGTNSSYLGPVQATPVAPVLPDASTAPSLSAKFAQHFQVGFAVDPWIMADPAANAIVVKHANSVTPETAMTAATIGVGPGEYDFSQAEAVVSFARLRHMSVRGFSLVSHDTTPAWFFAGNPDDPAYAATVRARLMTYVTDVVTHFKGKVAAWDVVNEPTSDDARIPYRKSQLYQVLGPSYITDALRAARAADPSAQLFINENGTEGTAKLSRLMAIVDQVRKSGAPLDGVGHQFHLDTSTPTSAVSTALNAVAARGLINHVTQLDISVYIDPSTIYGSAGEATEPELTGGPLIVAQQHQALQYRDLYNLFAATPSVKSVTNWGTDDMHSWLNTAPLTRANYATLFDRSGDPKSTFWAIANPSFAP